MKKIKIIGVAFVIILLSLVFFNQNRSFVKLPNNKFITIWKTNGNVCYIIPGKYYSPFKPINYIKTNNTNDITLFITDKIPNKILLDGENFEIINNSKKDISFDSYTNNIEKYKAIIYKDNAVKFSDVSDDVCLVNIDIGWMKITDKFGNDLE